MNTVLHTSTARIGLICLALALALPLAALAQDKQVDRAARRAQMQLQQMQQQLQEAQSAKSKTEADKAALEKRLADQGQDLARTQAAQRKAADGAKSAGESRAQLSSTVKDLQQQLADLQKSNADAIAAKDQALAQLTQQHDTERGQLQRIGTEQSKQLAECSDKNQRLVKLGGELADRYRRKGVWDAAKQSDPFLGLSDVEMFNVVQSYRDKLDVERFEPTAAGKPAAP